MVQLINFGSIATSGGKTTLSGTSSGIDTEGLLKALSEAKRLPAVQMEQSITNNKNKITALSNLKTALQQLKTALDGLRNPTIGSGATNAFSARTPYVSMTGGKTVSDYVGVTTSSGAPIGKFDIKINALAKAETRQSIGFPSRTAGIVEPAGGDSTGMFSAGTFKINGIDVTFNEGATLNDVAASINLVSSQSGVTASIVKFSETDYRLVLASKNTGVANGITITDPDNVLPTVGAAPSTPMFSVTQPPQDAQIEFNGETLTRPSNKITDLIENVTFSLYQETGAEKITLEVDKDNQQIATSIGSFVDAYNNVRVFAAGQQARDENGTLLKTSYLNNDPTLSTIMNKVSSLISGQASISIPTLYGSSSLTQPFRLGDLGISITDFAGDFSDPDNPVPATSNILQIDASKLQSQLETYFDNVRDIFEFGFTASSSNIGVYKRSNTVTDSNFKIEVNDALPIGQKAQITHIDGMALTTPISLNYDTVDGKTVISGQAGGPLANFKFTYSGDGTDTLNKSSGITNKDVTLNIDKNLPVGQQAVVTHIFGAALATPIAMEYKVSGNSASVNGLAGTPFAGLQMVYTGDGTDEIDISMKQGVADKMFNALDEMMSGLNNSTGVIDAAIESLQKTNDKLQESVDKIDEQIVTYRDRMMEKFSALEAAVASANSLLQLLGAQSDARNNS